MAGILKKNKRNSESSVEYNDSSMHFWGICCESGKQYAQVVGQRFRITKAVLDPKSSNNESGNKTVSLLVIRGGIEYLLCVLKNGEIQQVSLNLIFDKGENVKFYINGLGKVYLSGYQLSDSNRDVLNDENGFLCPLVEVKGKKEQKTPKASPNKGKAKSEEGTPRKPWQLILSKKVEDDDDEDDKDFSVGDEGTESEDDSSEDEVEEEELKEELEVEEEESEQKITMNSHGQKRKKTENKKTQKRARNSSFNNTSNSAENVICIDNGSDSDSDKAEKHSSPPKKQAKQSPSAEVPSETKKSKKKKKKKSKELMEISAISTTNSSQNEKPSKSPTESTPKKQNVIETGVEIQDVLVGKGPTATIGKTVHVFYVGRLPDKKIFDSRLPGKKPFSFKLGAHQVIEGWDIGLVGMKVGGKRKLKIPPSLAYGTTANDVIPPNSTLTFTVELQAVS